MHDRARTPEPRSVFRILGGRLEVHLPAARPKAAGGALLRGRFYRNLRPRHGARDRRGERRRLPLRPGPPTGRKPRFPRIRTSGSTPGGIGGTSGGRTGRPCSNHPHDGDSGDDAGGDRDRPLGGPQTRSSRRSRADSKGGVRRPERRVPRGGRHHHDDPQGRQECHGRSGRLPGLRGLRLQGEHHPDGRGAGGGPPPRRHRAHALGRRPVPGPGLRRDLGRHRERGRDRPGRRRNGTQGEGLPRNAPAGRRRCLPPGVPREGIPGQPLGHPGAPRRLRGGGLRRGGRRRNGIPCHARTQDTRLRVTQH
mmetsp:Transcript_3098/g.8403  ORF Transcript_3098/g.8403 Transcript_3098/m.8403 type:complete len:309 (+) Transcript_3098:1482-2408(+)